MKPTKAGLLTAEVRRLETENEELRKRLVDSISENARLQVIVDRRTGMRTEFEKLLEWPSGSTYDDGTFKRAVALVRRWKRAYERGKR